MDLIFGSLILKELLHYNFFQRLLNFVSKKKYRDIEVKTNWYENYILNVLTAEELKVWLRNVFSYNYSLNDTYYIPIELVNIPRNKLLKWISYNLFFKSMWQITKEQIDYADTMLRKIESKIEIKFPNSIDDSIYFLKFGNNKIECAYRPSLICSILDTMKDISYISLYLFNFTKYKVKDTDIVYFYYHCSDKSKTVLFIHGLGFGIEPYMYYILRLINKFNLIVLILPNISNMEYRRYINNITYDKIFPEYNTWRKVIMGVITKHNISELNIIGHSFGTIIAGILLQDDKISKLIKKKVFIEPVCFVDKSYKIFRYINEPKEGNYGTVSKLWNVFIYKDIYLRYVTQRFLYGPEFWIKDYKILSGNSLIILSEKDQVVPSDELYEKMKAHSVECLYLKGAYHADMFMSDEYEDTFNKIDSFLMNQ